MRPSVLADITDAPDQGRGRRHCCLPRRSSPRTPTPYPSPTPNLTPSSPNASLPSSPTRWGCYLPGTSFCEIIGRQLSFLPRLAKLLIVDHRCCLRLPGLSAAPPARRLRPRLRLRPRIVPRIRVVVRGQPRAVRFTPPQLRSVSRTAVPEADSVTRESLCECRERGSGMFGLAPRARSTPRQQSKLQSPVAGKEGDSLGLGKRVRTLPKGLMGVVR